MVFIFSFAFWFLRPGLSEFFFRSFPKGKSARNCKKGGRRKKSSPSRFLGSHTAFDSPINTATGYNALFFNTTGNANTATGESALTSNTTGGSNTANGDSPLASNTEGQANAATGAAALQSNTNGYSNTADGEFALPSNTTGHDNTANGLVRSISTPPAATTSHLALTPVAI